jgi:hypothetical protein
VQKSVAVLYFENLDDAGKEEYFRDGITEDICLTRVTPKGWSITATPGTPWCDGITRSFATFGTDQ